MKIGMIGIGDIAKKGYLPILTQTEDIELHICTRNKQTLEELTKVHPHIHTYSDMDGFIESGIEAVFVHSSTESHEAIIDELLDANIHVYVDKPITYEAASTERLIQKAKEKQLLLMVGFNRRYAPPYQELEKVPHPNMLIMQKNRANLPADARKLIFDDFIHVIDTILHLFPYTIKEVKVHGKHVEDKLEHITLQLEAAEGTAIGIMNRDAGTTNESLEVFSGDGIFKVNNVNETTKHKQKNIISYGQNDWEPTLQKRGFVNMIDTFLTRVKQHDIHDDYYDKDLKTHLLAEVIWKQVQK